MGVAQHRLQARRQRLGRQTGRRAASASRDAHGWRLVETAPCRKLKVWRVIEPGGLAGIRPSIRASSRSERSMKPASSARQSTPARSPGLRRTGLPDGRSARPAAGRPGSGSSGSRNARPPPGRLAPLDVDQGRDRIGKDAVWIGHGRVAAGLDEDRPARTQPTQGVVQPRRDGGHLGVADRLQIRTPKAGGALEGAVLVEHHARGDQAPPRAGSRRAAWAGGRYSRRSSIGSDLQPRGYAQVPATDLDDQRDRGGRPRPPGRGRRARRQDRPARGAGRGPGPRPGCR
jgi:hypothetical protein